MKSINLDQLQMVEAWMESDPTLRWKSSVPFTPAFPLFTGIPARDLTVVYFEMEAGHICATHTDSAEEVLLIVDGTVEVEMNGEKGQMSAGGMTIIPAMAPHSVRNVGTGKARCLGFFPSSATLHTWEEPVMPFGIRSLGAPPEA